MSSLLEILMDLSQELKKTVEEGYDQVFTFRDGNVMADSLPETMYSIAQVVKQVRPCVALQGNVYRIVLPGGMKGFAIVSWRQDNDE